MKLKGKWVSLATVLLTLAMLASLVVACGSTPTPAPKPTTAPVVQPTKAAPTEVPPTEVPPTEVPPTEAPPAVEGVTAAQVQQLLQEKFNAVDRDLTLWNIQPGLGTVMMEYGRRFALVKLAADAGDWGMAQYQLKEQTEIQEVGEATRPAKAELLKGFEHTYLDPVATAIENKDKAAFDKAYDAAVEGCNGCHAGTEHPYIKFIAPADSPEDFLSLAASEPAAEEEHGAAPEPTAAPDQALTWAELGETVDSYFNNVDRQLSLWGIQPGLGTVMMEYGRRFALAKHAVDAGDWGMAQYQIKEQVEIQEVGETTRSGKAELLAGFEHAFLDPVAKAIEDQDADAFNKAYEAAIGGCNGCHVGTGHPYVRYQMPPTSPENFLTFAPSESEAAEEETHPEAAVPSYPSGNPTLDDAKKMIDDRFNNIDRSLALWNIQPGLGTIMQEYGYRFGNVWTAAEAGNWGLAAYELKEQTEIQELGEVTRPGKAELLKGFEHAYLDAVSNAITAQDKAAFEDAYNAAVEGCNACHVGTGHAYVRYVTPETAPANFLEMSGQ